MKKGFTLIELILVIVIMAILATFAINIYGNIYTNYIYARAVNDLESRTQNVMEQISARLKERIPQATIGRTGVNGAITPINVVDETYDVLEWLGKSDASMKLGIANQIGWSGFVDLEESNATNIITPGSNLLQARDNLQTLGIATNDLGVYFVGGFQNVDASGFGFDSGAVNKIVSANLNTSTDENLSIDTTGYTGRITQRYYLTDSAYALVPTNMRNYIYTYNGRTLTSSEFDLILYYNYKPWNGEKLTDARSQILARNVTLFRFRGDYDSIDLKICLRTDKIPGGDFVVCKTKVVE